MKTIEQLQADLIIAERKRNGIKNRIEQHNRLIEFPKWVAKFKGKYFKYINAVSSDDMWPVYIFVSDVTFRSSYRGYDIEGFAFECDYQGDITFKTKELYYMVDDSTIEISKSQFNQALKRMKEKLEKITLTTPHQQGE
jgi:hypothetical protein